MLDLSGLAPGLTGSARVAVTSAQTAIEVGSGAVAVFASPMMIALMEAACVDCVERLLPAGYVSLGTHLDVTHTSPTPIGLTVVATAELKAIEGRKITFDVEARDDREVIGKCRHTRMIVDLVRFNARLAEKTIPV